ncbi:MAG: heavy-metal-associated domain-containing protein [Bacteroidota bacterium]|nr:heavy-metal-associated domain-containing protein [Bacteroidota bacterium]MDP3144001.1 heavy-metal-associated domain-containing protein [Bacteroidota bacterium]MDP3557500.1 heavy-metal-associated domain-containing protein [Bacteroidota bacterium]
MMRIIGLVFLFSFLFFISCGTKSNTVVEKTFHVWGNNDICKKSIEKASKLNGVSDVNWNLDSKLLVFKIDTTVITTDAVLKSVASAGFDNELFYGNDYAYSNLPEACQYERRDN